MHAAIMKLMHAIKPIILGLDGFQGGTFRSGISPVYIIYEKLPYVLPY